MTRPGRVLLCAMPWMNPAVASLALGTLAPILRAADIAVDTLYGNLLFPRTPTDTDFLDHQGSFLFVPLLHPGTDVEGLIGRMAGRYLDELNLRGLVADDAEVAGAMLGVTRAEVVATLRGDVVRARVCLERCLAVASAPHYDVVGFTSTFETQLPAALALARRLKAKNPDIRIVFGGAACFEEQGDALVDSFPEIDVVCHTEGESVIVPVVRALRGELPLGDVPGISFREGGRLRHNPSPELLTELDRVPMPEYGDYMAALAASEWRAIQPRLLFETSRGCWWGQKHLCSFCGLNAEGLAFRSKSPERAYREIEHLYRSYPQADFLQATDNILDTKYVATLMPRLAGLERDPDRPLQIFYEVKSSLRAPELRLLALAGVRAIQPGIESFADEILELMDKGCTGLGQVQFLKWAYQEGIQPVYNLLVCNPGEEASSYRDMLDLLPFLSHLPPPSGLTRVALERFSPFFMRPERFGISNKRPKPYYRELYPEPSVDLDRIAYQFEYDHAMFDDEELKTVLRAFTRQAIFWRRDWQERRAFYVDRGDHLLLVDRRAEAEVVTCLTGVAAEAYRYLDSVRTFDQVTARFADVEPAFLRVLLDGWRRRRVIYGRADGRHLALLPLVREGVRDAAADLAETLKSLRSGRRNPLPLIERAGVDRGA